MHSLYKSYLFFYVAIFLIGCSSASTPEKHTLQALQASLENSSMLIQDNNERIYYSFKQKLTAPETREIAMQWYPKMEMVKNYCDSIINYIEALKTELRNEAGINTKDNHKLVADNKALVRRIFIERQKGVELLERLEKYQENILNTDSRVSKEFKNRVGVINYYDSIDDKKTNFSNYYFRNNSVLGALAILTGFKNNCIAAQYEIIRFYNSIVIVHNTEYGQISYHAFQNSKYFKAGDYLEISAGIGKFGTPIVTNIKIDGQTVAVGEDGLATYTAKVSSKPGKYFIPVQISFTSPDGLPHTVSRNMNYTIIP